MLDPLELPVLSWLLLCVHRSTLLRRRLQVVVATVNTFAVAHRLGRPLVQERGGDRGLLQLFVVVHQELEAAWKEFELRYDAVAAAEDGGECREAGVRRHAEIIFHVGEVRPFVKGNARFWTFAME